MRTERDNLLISSLLDSKFQWNLIVNYITPTKATSERIAGRVAARVTGPQFHQINESNYYVPSKLCYVLCPKGKALKDIKIKNCP